MVTRRSACTTIVGGSIFDITKIILEVALHFYLIFSMTSINLEAGDADVIGIHILQDVL
jgi:hypothetical protein